MVPIFFFYFCPKCNFIMYENMECQITHKLYKLYWKNCNFMMKYNIIINAFITKHNIIMYYTFNF